MHITLSSWDKQDSYEYAYKINEERKEEIKFKKLAYFIQTDISRLEPK